MTPTLWKNTFREIWQSKGRFFAIVAIIALGVGFFAGVKGASPTMLKSAEKYYVDSRLMDIRVISTVGFNDDDVSAIEKVDGVEKVKAGYMLDVMVDTENSAEVYRIHTIDTDKEPLNKLNVVDGRLPKTFGEIVVEENFTYKVGDTLSIQQYAGDTNVDDQLKTREYKVVGIVETPLYMSYKHATTTIGGGVVSYSAYLLPREFKSERYTEIFIDTKYSNSEISPFDDSYTDGVQRIADKIDLIAQDRIQAFNVEVLEPAKDELRDGEVEYASEASNIEKQLADAQKKIDDGKKELATETASAKQYIDDSEKKLVEGESQLPYSISTYYEEILSAQNEINSNELLLQEAKGELTLAKTTYQTQISQGQTQIDTAQAEYDKAYNEFYNITKPQAEEKIATLTPIIDELQEKIKKLRQLVENSILISDKEKYLKEIDDVNNLISSYKNQLESGKQQLADGENQLTEAKTKLDTAKTDFEQAKIDGQNQIDIAQTKIDNAEQQLKTAKTEFDKAKKEGRKKLDDAQNQLVTGKQQITDGRQQLEETEKTATQQLDKAQATLDDKTKKAQKELSEARKKLDDAQKQLDKLSSPKWYITMRKDLSGYGSYYDDTQSVDAIAMVFPLFFLAVAVLVCLTTMSRLLEERRTEIGTLKALGYSSLSILSKYIIYAGIGAVMGSIIGCIIGVATLPKVIFDVYLMLYDLPSMELAIPWDSIIYGFIASILCTCGVVLYVGIRLLRAEPAKLMRPKAPRPGKRILLERIPTLWQRFGFTSKVTARNIFRYKSRFFMTVLGVAGCTALIVSAFGLRDSINAVITEQFGNVMLYSGVVVPADNVTDVEFDKLKEYISNYENVEAVEPFSYQTGKVVDENGKQHQISVYTIKDVSKIGNIMDLHTRIGREPLSLENDGVILTEKIANVLGLKVGDSITYEYNSNDYTVKINSICENHVNNYIYMTPEYYKTIYDGEPKYNILVEKHNMNDEQEKALGTKLLERDDVIGVTFLSGNIEGIQDMLNNLNVIVYVMIICAAALAFVVLYNLTNINIAERKKEIATIKVLGFYNSETSAYVYRENIVLTVVGIAVGLILGIFLNNFIITTAEVDTVMFGRNITPLSFIYASIFTAIFALIVNFVMFFKIKAVNMVESLKSIE